MVPTNARLLADLMNACVDVDENIDAAKQYTSCFQVLAGCFLCWLLLAAVPGG